LAHFRLATELKRYPGTAWAKPEEGSGKELTMIGPALAKRGLGERGRLTSGIQRLSKNSNHAARSRLAVVLQGWLRPKAPRPWRGCRKSLSLGFATGESGHGEV